MIGWVVAAIAVWVGWTHRQHTKPQKALPNRHHFHWLHHTGELPQIKAKDHE